ncbi:rod shape-determining protein RodA [Candidatus Woesebacteria bacterium]|nr:rod shape-determining protein RodA [Candidatus Woesebacteria bacterium]
MKNWLIPLSIFLLFLLSILTLMSIAPALAPKQLIFFIVGFAIFFLVSKIQFNRILKLGTLMYLLNIAFLIVVLVLAPITRGSARWIDVGGLFSIQPSQLAIPTSALFLINYFSKKSLTKFKNLINFIFLALIPGILILIEPDLGTTLVFITSVSIIIFLSETKLKHTIPLVVISLLIATFSWFFVLHQYQKDRVISFISPSDTQGTSYNAIQSIIAVGSGNLSGKGIGQGIQSHLRFLPERQTDFIFASFAEEFGFIGSLVLIFLYLTLILTTISTANKSNEQTEKLFCNVIVVMTTMQIGVNIGMNIGILPITGITLPFMSYGGSSIISLMLMFGVIQTIRLNQKQKSTLHIS